MLKSQLLKSGVLFSPQQKIRIFKNPLNWAGIVMVIVLIFFVGWGISDWQPPRPVSADAPADQFSSGRAMIHLRAISKEPHIIGTAANHRVRDYLVRELEKMGCKPEIQRAQVIRSRSASRVRAAMVENVMVRLKGTAPTKALLLLSHYDTVPNTVGASDDGSSVVCMLETLRALKEHSPRRNDVIFLFTDGEEIGLMGAKAFVDDHPWAKDVGVVLNFEASGSSGPSMMFETSDQNGWLIKQMAKSATNPIANSLSYEIYKRMPNDTDLTMFKNKGISGYNFAYIDSRYDYHTPSDNLENIAEGSLQHHGTYGLSMALHLANVDLTESQSPNHVYFNIPGRGFIHYPEKMLLPFLILTGLCLVVLFIFGFRNKVIRFWGAISGFFAFLVNLVIGPLIITLLFQIITKSYEGVDSRLLFYYGKGLLLGSALISVAVSLAFYRLLLKGIKIYHLIILVGMVYLLLKLSHQFHWLYAAITVVVAIICYLLFRKGRSVWDLSAGSLFGWSIIMVAGSLIVPGVSYLLTWPLFFSIIPLLLLFAARRREHNSFLFMSLFLVFAIPAVHMFSGLIYVFFLAMGVDLIGGVMIAVMLTMALLIPHIHYISKTDRWIVPGLAFLLGTILLIANTKGAEFTERYRRPSCLFYAYDGDRGEGAWCSTYPAADEWTSTYLTQKPDTTALADFLPGSHTRVLENKISDTALDLPNIEVLRQFTSGDERTLKFRFISGRQANEMYIYFKSTKEITGVNLNGEEISRFQNEGVAKSDRWYRYTYDGLPVEGIEFTIRLKQGGKLSMRLTDVSQGLPLIADYPLTPRPPHLMAAPGSFSDMILVTKGFVF